MGIFLKRIFIAFLLQVACSVSVFAVEMDCPDSFRIPDSNIMVNCGCIIKEGATDCRKKVMISKTFPSKKVALDFEENGMFTFSVLPASGRGLFVKKFILYPVKNKIKIETFGENVDVPIKVTLPSGSVLKVYKNGDIDSEPVIDETNQAKFPFLSRGFPTNGGKKQPDFNFKNYLGFRVENGIQTSSQGPCRNVIEPKKNSGGSCRLVNSECPAKINGFNPPFVVNHKGIVCKSNLVYSDFFTLTNSHPGRCDVENKSAEELRQILQRKCPLGYDLSGLTEFNPQPPVDSGAVRSSASASSATQ